MAKIVVVTMHGRVMSVFTESPDTEVVVIDMDCPDLSHVEPHYVVVEFPNRGRHAGCLHVNYETHCDRSAVASLFNRAGRSPPPRLE